MTDIDFAPLLNQLGLGLSRLLRYSYPGFLVVVITAALRPEFVKSTREAISWYIAIPSILVLGAAVYSVHRNLLIPLHHLILCLLLFIWEKVRHINNEDSLSPTRWLASHGVSRWRRISAYQVLRQSNIFKKDMKDDINLIHAENGLIVMTAVVLSIGAFSTYCCRSPVAWIIAIVVAWVASFSRAIIQHRIECGYFRAREGEVKKLLCDWGFNFE